MNYLFLHLEYESLWKRNLVREIPALLAQMVRATDAAFGYATVFTDFRGGGYYEDYSPEPVELMGVSIGDEATAGPGLECISPFVWLNVYGTEYVEYIGRERLQSLPVDKVWETDSGHLWLRLCEWPHELYEPSMLERRNAMVESLNLGDALCGKGRIQNFRWVHSGPEFDRSELQGAG